jgi:hypothetical protein
VNAVTLGVTKTAIAAVDVVGTVALRRFRP